MGNGRSTLLEQVASQPLNTAVILLCTGIYLHMWNRRIGLEGVSTSYRKVVLERQYYRVVTATFTHASLMHIVFNMGGLISIGLVESLRGHYFYLYNTILLVLLSEALFLGGTHLLITYGGRPQLTDASAVGYSGVLFGWMTILYQLQPSFGIPLPGGVVLPMSVAPFVSLFITQILIPRASFLGHLAGIIAGLLISWGAMGWLTGYWFWTSVTYAAFAMLVSLRANSSLPPWIARFVAVSPAFVQGTWGLGGSPSDDVLLVGGGGGGTAPRRFMDASGVLRTSREVDVEGGGGGANSTAPGNGGGSGAFWMALVRAFGQGSSRRTRLTGIPYRARATGGGEGAATSGGTAAGGTAAAASTAAVARPPQLALPRAPPPGGEVDVTDQGATGVNTSPLPRHQPSLLQRLGAGFGLSSAGGSGYGRIPGANSADAAEDEAVRRPSDADGAMMHGGQGARGGAAAVPLPGAAAAVAASFDSQGPHI